MSVVGDDRAMANAFEQERGRLTAVALRILGSREDAEDAVQEAWLRLTRQDAAIIDNVAAWLTTVVSRLCIDMLRSRTAKAETALEDRLDWTVTGDVATPEQSAMLADSVGAALQIVLDTLTPDERLAFVLHDTFGVPFAEIGEIIGKSTDAAKMLASRARRKVRTGGQTPNPQRQRDVVDAFITAAREGDFEALLKVLDPELTWSIHTPRGVIERHGAAELISHTQRGRNAGFRMRRVQVGGHSGILAWRADGAPFAIMRCTVVGDRMTAVESLTDPARLADMQLPAPTA